MKLLLVSTLALATWLYPVNVASALLTEQKIEEQVTQSVNEQVLGSNAQPEVVEDVSTKNHPTVEPKDDVNTPKGGSNQTPYSGRNYSKTEIEELIRATSAKYGIAPGLPLKIAFCESGYNQFSANRASSARGTFQYLAGTWANTPEGKSGKSVFDAEAHINAAVRHIAVHGTAPWNASKHCWNK